MSSDENKRESRRCSGIKNKLAQVMLDIQVKKDDNLKAPNLLRRLNCWKCKTRIKKIKKIKKQGCLGVLPISSLGIKSLTREAWTRVKSPAPWASLPNLKTSNKRPNLNRRWSLLQRTKQGQTQTTTKKGKAAPWTSWTCRTKTSQTEAQSWTNTPSSATKT